MDAINSLSSISFSASENSQASNKTSANNNIYPVADFAKVLDASSETEVSAKAEAAAKFETMVLSQFIDEIFKEQSAGAFGEGAGGDFYSSVFSNAIAKELSNSRSFGIAKLL